MGPSLVTLPATGFFVLLKIFFLRYAHLSRERKLAARTLLSDEGEQRDGQGRTLRGSYASA
jgi:hypothetical protein